MILGILIGMYMGLYNTSIALFFYLEIVIILIACKLKSKKIVVLFFVILISFSYAKFTEYKYDNAFIKSEKSYIAKVVSLKEETKYFKRYTVQIKSGKYKNYRALVHTKEELQYGDIIKFNENIEKPETARNDKRI